MSHLKQTLFISESIERVWEYAYNPKRWSEWFAHLTGPEGLDGTGEVGTVGKFQYSLLGRQFPITIEVKAMEKQPERCYWRCTFDGPLHGSQEYTYVSKNGGTEVTTELEYTVPGSVLGKVADLVVVERMQANAINHSLNNLKVVCERM